MTLKAMSPGWHEWTQENEWTAGSCTHWCWGSEDKRGDRGGTPGHGTKGLGSAGGSHGEMVEWQHLHHWPLPGHPQTPALTRVGVITAGLGLGLGLGSEVVLSESSSLLGQPNGRLAHGHRPHTSTPNIPSALCPTHQPWSILLLCSTTQLQIIPCSVPYSDLGVTPAMLHAPPPHCTACGKAILPSPPV